jgi:molybdate transport system regulatory protein
MAAALQNQRPIGPLKRAKTSKKQGRYGTDTLVCAFIRPMPPKLIPRLRVVTDGTIVLGPGKADLLEAISRLGTLRDAAAAMEMSYMRAWKLVRVMNEAFREPLVITTRGGADGGRAELTPAGDEALKLYRRIERESIAATGKSWKTLRKMLR